MAVKGSEYGTKSDKSGQGGEILVWVRWKLLLEYHEVIYNFTFLTFFCAMESFGSPGTSMDHFLE